MEGDKIRIRQVLFNLIGNSMKFTPDGGAITVSAGETDSGFIKFSVTDTGIGIAGEDQKKLFRPFSQLDTPDTKRFAGTGLGLSICRKIVELHGGRIWLESEVGRGTVFIFKLPAARKGD
jgi:signal transduction histidine kinase